MNKYPLIGNICHPFTFIYWPFGLVVETWLYQNYSDIFCLERSQDYAINFGMKMISGLAVMIFSGSRCFFVGNFCFRT